MIERIDACLMALRRIMRATELHGRELVRAVGLTPVQLRVVQIVDETGQATGSAIARRMHVSQATITALVDRLEKAGIVSRRPDPSDRRQTLIVLTERGRQTLAAAPDALQQRFSRAFDGLADWEQAMLVASLERVAAMLDADRMDTSAVLHSGDIRAPITPP